MKAATLGAYVGSLLLIACAHQVEQQTQPAVPETTKTYTGVDSYQRYVEDQAAQAAKERQQQCSDARAGLIKATSDNDLKRIEQLQSTIKNFCN